MLSDQGQGVFDQGQGGSLLGEVHDGDAGGLETGDVKDAGAVQVVYTAVSNEIKVVVAQGTGGG